VLLAGLLAACVVPAPAQDEEPADWQDYLSQGIEWLEETDISDLEWPSAQDWTAFWQAVESALHADSIEELAWMLPEVEAAEEILGRFPETRPLAGWLKARHDYFEMAGQQARQQQIPPRPKPPPKAAAPQKVVPPPRPPAVVKARPARPLGDVEAWKKKIAGRPPPAGAGKLMPGLKRIFREEGVPPELAWLAEVESTLDPAARSPVGAVGLYQLMPATAQRFGVSLRPRDERLKPEKNARAAAQYLRFLKTRFASWPLALAAYNAGEGRVGRAMKKTGAATFEELAPHLPVETQMYVPKTLAVVELREGVSL
jgi:membrane-bound lytic murein transglycosylase D